MGVADKVATDVDDAVGEVDVDPARLLSETDLSRRTVQKILVQLHSILKRAKRKGRITSNPADDAERVTVPRTGEFNVLTPDEVHRRLVRTAS